MTTINIKTTDGEFDINENLDRNYPGVDIEFTPNNYNNLPENELYTKPRVVLENIDGRLDIYVWTNKQEENYSHKMSIEL